MCVLLPCTFLFISFGCDGVFTFARLGGEIGLKFFGGNPLEGIVQFEVYVRLV